MPYKMKHILLLLILTTQHCLVQPTLSEKCNPQEKKALLQIKKELGNPSQLSSWNPTTDCCQRGKGKWLGVVCPFYAETYFVTALGLESLHLPKPVPIPPTIFTGLPFLDTLYVDSIPNLVGPIPPLVANLTKLQYISILSTNISGEILNTLTQIKSLVSIHFYDNKLMTGTLPDTLPTSLPNLAVLWITQNQLTGSIPESYGSFPKSFIDLSLSGNRLSGKIPASLAKLNLKYVDLSSNALEGDASVFFGSKKKTEEIWLGWNRLSFDIGKVELSKYLNELDLRSNRIYGSLPKGLVKLKHLKKFNVSNNDLCGEIPVGGNLKRFDESSYAHNKCLCGSPLPPCKV